MTTVATLADTANTGRAALIRAGYLAKTRSPNEVMKW